jgi:DNA-binding MarR family transcriptional regulator
MVEAVVNVDTYAETITLIERLHRRFLDVLRVELERLGIEQINNVQSLLLANIGEDDVSVGELMSRGYYLGSNVSYNLKRLVTVGLVVQERSHHDRRVVRVRLSPEGRTVRAQIGRIFARHSEELAELRGASALTDLNTRLYDLEQFWTDQVASQAVRRVSHFSDLAEARTATGARD